LFAIIEAWACHYQSKLRFSIESLYLGTWRSLIILLSRARNSAYTLGLFRSVRLFLGFSLFSNNQGFFKLLTQSEGNITSLSYQVGFSDALHFTRCFKKHFDMTPTECRQCHAC